MKVESIKAKIKGMDYHHYVALGITLLFVLLGAFVYRNSYIRFYETCRDFVESIIQYFNFLMGEEVSKDVNVLGPSSITYPLVIAFEEFKAFFVNYWNAFITLDNFKDYLSLVFKIVFFVSTLGGIVVLIFYILSRIFSNVFYNENDKYPFEPSKPLTVALLFGKKVYRPVKSWVLSFVYFLRNHITYLKVWLIIWLFNLNVVSIVIGFLAYFFYFSVSYNVGSLFFQFYKLILDLSLMIGGLPFIAWLIIAGVIFTIFSLKIGRRRLQRIEGLCEKFIKSLKSVVVFLVGTMGKGKTKIMTDMALTQRNIFRDKAFEILRNRDLEFPDFPWVKLEKLIIVNMMAGRCSKPYDVLTLLDEQYNRLLVYKKLCRRIDKHNVKKNDNVSYDSALPFGYDFFNEKTKYSNGLYLKGIFQVLSEYGQAFFLYVCDNLNVSNYSIRFDDELKSLGNFPLWDYDFTNKTVDKYNYLSRYSYILDFDQMRLTKKLKENMLNGLLTTGVITITEIGKERGNQVELQGIRKEEKKANQKNDGFNKFIKFCRHLSTISFYPFIKVFVDDQRPESWGADGKDLTQIVKVGDEEPTRSALPFFGIFDYFATKLLEKYSSIYYKYRFYREDRTLLIYLFKTFMSKVYAIWDSLHIKFDYTPVHLSLGAGTQDGEFTEATYYLASHKIYNNRYSTDCYSEIFQSVKSKGLTKLTEYQDIHMTTEEFERQNSYLYQDLEGISKGAKNGK